MVDGQVHSTPRWSLDSALLSFWSKPIPPDATYSGWRSTMTCWCTPPTFPEDPRVCIRQRHIDLVRLIVRRPLVEQGIQMMMSRSLITAEYTAAGIYHYAGDWALVFVNQLQSRYVAQLQDRAKWVIERSPATATNAYGSSCARIGRNGAPSLSSKRSFDRPTDENHSNRQVAD